MARKKERHIAANVLAALTTSVVSLTLGAALGMLSLRGAFAGMISAAVFPMIACAFGGTRIKVSGPTVPMSAMMALIVAYVSSNPEFSDSFVSTVIYEVAILLMLAGLLKTGRFIKLVPRVVVSGFMTGIGVLVWLSQVDTVIGGTYADPHLLPVFLTFLSLALIFLSPRIFPRIPGTLSAMAVVTALVHLFPEYFSTVPLVGKLPGGIPNLAIPDLSGKALVYALPYALNLFLLCYLDTLLTAHVMDIVTKEETDRDKELEGQGLATFAAALAGGIPGAQSTIRSFLIIKEGATERFAGVLVGFFVLIELYLLKGFIAVMPKALFAGILLKVGYDVVDWGPLRLYFRRYWLRIRGLEDVRTVPDVMTAAWAKDMYVGHLEAAIIFATTAITVLVDLNVAVLSFTVVFFLFRFFHVILDMKPYELLTSDLIAILKFRGDVTFDRLKSLRERLEADTTSRIVVFYMGDVDSIDDTGALALKATIGWLKDHKRVPLMATLSRSSKEMMSAVGVMEDVGNLNFFRTLDRALIYADHLLEKKRDGEEGLHSYLTKELVFLDVEVSSKDDIFRLAAMEAFEAGYVLHEESFYLDLVLSEERGSTGLEKGIAMPHCRSTQIMETFVVYMRLKEPMDSYATLDGSPVKHVFVIGGTEHIKTYMRVMAKIASVIHESDTLGELSKATDVDFAYGAIVGRDLKVHSHEGDDGL
jgi:SulP family sulfate permease